MRDPQSALNSSRSGSAATIASFIARAPCEPPNTRIENSFGFRSRLGYLKKLAPHRISCHHSLASEVRQRCFKRNGRLVNKTAPAGGWSIPATRLTPSPASARHQSRCHYYRTGNVSSGADHNVRPKRSYQLARFKQTLRQYHQAAQPRCQPNIF